MDTPVKPKNPRTWSGPAPTAVLRALPVAALMAAAFASAWVEHGSILAKDWLPYAVLAALVLATVLLSGTPAKPTRPAAVALAALAGLAVWATLSLTWSPAPSLARDEGLLTALYAVTFAVPLLTLRTLYDRLAATVALVLGLSALALATAVELIRAGDVNLVYLDGRLNYPISYANAQAAIFLVAFWPALALAARRSLSPVVRAFACGAATSFLSGWLLTQSKGGGLALAVSAVVFFAVSGSRVRMLVPTLIVGGVAAAGFYPLTQPFRASLADYLTAVHRAGWALLVLSALSAALGLVYALVDRRITVPQRTSRLAGRLALAAVLVAVLGGIGAFAVSVSNPSTYLSDKWRTFKKLPEHETGASHFSTLGSNRYDFWRVSLDQLERHPVAGVGARGFGPVYLQHRRSPESPRRAHSLELEVLMEDGVVGFALLALGIGLPLLGALRQARRPSAAASLAGGVYWLAHASVDWIWTFPAAGIPFFVLLGIGSSAGDRPLLSRRVARYGAGLAILLALVAFAPPWISSRYVASAYLDSSESTRASDIRWARRFDPISLDPLIAEGYTTQSQAGVIAAFRRAETKEPRNVQPHYALGVIYLGLGRKADAKRELEAALRLDPHERVILMQLRRAR